MKAPLGIVPFAAVAAFLTTAAPALPAQSPTSTRWVTLETSARGGMTTVVAYDAASVDSSGGSGRYRLQLRETHDRQHRESRSQSYASIGGRSVPYDGIAQAVMFDCPGRRVREGGAVYLRGAVRLPGQDEPSPLSEWRTADRDASADRALQAFCRKRT